MYPFIENKIITDLGFGSGFALWGFRAIASGKGSCCQLTSGFNRAFAMDNKQVHSQHGGRHGRLAINALKSFSYQLGYLGKRKIMLSEAGSMRLTADELCIVATLSTAQIGNDDLCHAHLMWLLAQTETTYARHAAVTYGIICEQAGIEMKSLQTDGNSPQGIKKPPVKGGFSEFMLGGLSLP